MHRLPSLFKKISRIVGVRPSSCPLNEVKACAVSSNGSFKYRFRMFHNNAHKSVLVSKWSQQFQIVSIAVRLHFLASLFSKCSLKFHIVSDALRMHPLLHLFSKFLCSSKLFQTSSECTLYYCDVLILKSISFVHVFGFLFKSNLPYFNTSDRDLTVFEADQFIYFIRLVAMFHFTIHVFKIIRWGRHNTSCPPNTKSISVPASNSTSFD